MSKANVSNEVSFFKKPMSIKVFWALVIAISISCFILFSMACFDGDMYFMIATGRHIIENGIPHENVWTIDKSSGFIAQQWLYDVILAYLDRVGYVALWVFVLFQVSVFNFFVYRLCRIRDLSNPAAFLCIALSDILGLPYLFNIRPQTITLILLLIECIALEKYAKTKNWKWLVLLPVSVLAEANLHMSMWPMHFAFLLAYFVPSFYYKSAISTDLFKYKKSVLITAAVMFLMLFINPYGLDGVLYLFRSLSSNVFDFMHVIEVDHTMFFSSTGLLSVILAVYVLFLCKLKAVTSVTLNFCLGLLLLMTNTVRNVVYAPIVIIYLFLDTWRYIKDNNKIIDWKKDVTRVFYFILTPVFMWTGYTVSMNLFSMSFDVLSICGVHGYWSIMTMESYISDHAEKDVHLFTSINNGSYFEYKGYTNVYVDARPELFSKNFTGDRDIAKDYKSYAVDGVHTEGLNFVSKNFTHDIKEYAVTEFEMKAWLDEYEFEYLIVDTSTNYLSGYLSGSDEYEQIVFAHPTYMYPYVLYHHKTAD